MVDENNTNRHSAYTLAHTPIVASVISLCARSFVYGPTLDAEISAVVSRELENAYRAGQRSEPPRPRGSADVICDELDELGAKVRMFLAENRAANVAAGLPPEGAAAKKIAAAIERLSPLQVDLPGRSSCKACGSQLVACAPCGDRDRAELDAALGVLRAIDATQGKARAIIDQHLARKGRR